MDKHGEYFVEHTLWISIIQLWIGTAQQSKSIFREYFSANHNHKNSIFLENIPTFMSNKCIHTGNDQNAPDFTCKIT